MLFDKHPRRHHGLKRSLVGKLHVFEVRLSDRGADDVRRFVSERSRADQELARAVMPLKSRARSDCAATPPMSLDAI